MPGVAGEIKNATVSLDRKHGTRLDGAAVEEDRTGSAERGFAADMRAGQAGDFAKKMHQQKPRLDGLPMRLPIDIDCHVLLHVTPRTEEDYGGQI